MSAPICPTHGEGFGVPCYMCVDAENRTLRELYAEAVRALAELDEVAGLRGDNALPHPCDDPKLWTARMQDAWDDIPVVLSRPEAQAVLKEAPRG